jgi:hypothetical protein
MIKNYRQHVKCFLDIILQIMTIKRRWKMSKSVSITCVADDHIQWGSPVAGSIHVEEFVGDNLMGGQFFDNMNSALEHVRNYLEESVILRTEEVN